MTFWRMMQNTEVFQYRLENYPSDENDPNLMRNPSYVA